jgi:hypothetical protein
METLFLQTTKEWYVVAAVILSKDERAFSLEGFSWLKTSTSERRKKERKKLEDLPRRRGAVLEGELLSSVEGEGVLNGPGAEFGEDQGGPFHEGAGVIC